jgi:hypothetical protein
MKKYVNGYKDPVFDLVWPDGRTRRIKFSFKYKYLREFYEKVSATIETLDGRKLKKPRFVRHEWELSLEDYSENPDTLKFRDIENAEIEGAQIYLTPNEEIFWRKIRVIIKDEKRMLDIEPDFDGDENTANRGLKITFANADRMTTVNIADPNFIPVYAFDEDY